jgi:hypothetical protein
VLRLKVKVRHAAGDTTVELAQQPAQMTPNVGNTGTQPKIHESKTANSKPGLESKKQPTRPHEFTVYAGTLWRANRQMGRKVTPDKLLIIAVKLDEKGYTPPSKYLEGNASKAVRTHNKHQGNSELKQIRTWRALVESEDKDFVRGMGRLLSRCASQCPE